MQSSCFVLFYVLRMQLNQALAEVVPWLAPVDRFEVGDGGNTAGSQRGDFRPRQSGLAKVCDE